MEEGRKQAREQQTTKAASGEYYKWWQRTLTLGKQLDTRTDTKTEGFGLTKSTGQSGGLAWRCERVSESEYREYLDGSGNTFL